MKQTVKTSRAAGQLEKMFRALNTRFFDGKLPEPVITLKKTPGAYGHITCGKTWTAGTEQRHEINISTATLDRPIEETTATLLHEMCHLYNMVNGIKDTSGSANAYHNKRFKETAESHGLIIEHHAKYGWTVTSPSLELLDFIELQGWQAIQMTEGLSWQDTAPPVQPMAVQSSRPNAPTAPGGGYAQSAEPSSAQPKKSASYALIAA